MFLSYRGSLINLHLCKKIWRPEFKVFNKHVLRFYSQDGTYFEESFTSDEDLSKFCHCLYTGIKDELQIITIDNEFVKNNNILSKRHKEFPNI